jgi:MFS family permease
MLFQPSETLKSRTFIGLIVAQFLAGFNDQAIHASSMFFAIHHHTLTEAGAISLMPILFYAPWAIFCTMAGYLADRYSKRVSLVFWKIAEIAITLIALAGFWLGVSFKNPWGPWVVLSTVFLMGTHAAFFAPAKYGAMPEILQPQALSRGNGILESTTFLAAILGTVFGGVLSFVFKDEEYFIGLILVGLAVLGAVASLLIAHMPAANPTRPFPRNLLRPLLDNLRVLWRSRPLALSVIGIAFFIFMVSFMRATMYMHGESRIPRWNEYKTSLVVATVALGVGLGAPLAGFLSAGKVELGLVPLGAVGMIVSALVAAFALDWLPGLVGCLVLIGFFSGFYMVPLYTLLQHRAPKTSKGDLVATSNFINVTGAIAASVLFFVLVFLAHRLGVTPEVKQKDIAHGTLTLLDYDKRTGRPREFRLVRERGGSLHRQVRPAGQDEDPWGDEEEFSGKPIEIEAEGVERGDEVAISRYTLQMGEGNVIHYRLRPASEPMEPAYNNEALPRYLFIGAGAMTLIILILLCRQLPDFFVRALLWLRSHGRYHLKVIGVHHLPTEGGVILATNCDGLEKCMQVITATDRFTRFILLERDGEVERERPRFLAYLARRTRLVTLHLPQDGPPAWDWALAKGIQAIQEGNLLGVTVDGEDCPLEAERFVDELRGSAPAPVVPVYCGSADTNGTERMARVRVVIGQPLRPEVTVAEARLSIRLLGEWIHQTEEAGVAPATALIPAVSSASPTGSALDRPGRP